MNRFYLNSKILLTLLSFLLVFFLPYKSRAGVEVPHFALPSAVDGSTIDISQFKGKVILINFFATWCAPCRIEIPELIKLQDKFGPKGFTAIGISVDQNGSKLVKRFAREFDINYPVLLANAKVTRDFGGVSAVPTTFLVDRKGNVVKYYPGLINRRVFENDLKQLLK
ncbi:MAG: TlpA family protein disulfide reductase [Desulfobulbaceae bacterium]|nr:TlpA family protein disulfide reductase [Desulfobulbaceae bacterium]MCK5323111.1 TlpA family protein disulfide reductase [Desulfobulbaceae bacterium]MCK5437823.1 TlpA family protein disulfide reductase [Desulfobulbaceae bacterium]MCK5544771.1 TlpA family protein disulfide reductase [Desulfobulbaceae bacterium]